MADSKEHTFITESNAKMISAEIENRLGGRLSALFIFLYKVNLLQLKGAGI